MTRIRGFARVHRGRKCEKLKIQNVNDISITNSSTIQHIFLANDFGAQTLLDNKYYSIYICYVYTTKNGSVYLYGLCIYIHFITFELSVLSLLYIGTVYICMGITVTEPARHTKETDHKIGDFSHRFLPHKDVVSKRERAARHCNRYSNTHHACFSDGNVQANDDWPQAKVQRASCGSFQKKSWERDCRNAGVGQALPPSKLVFRGYAIELVQQYVFFACLFMYCVEHVVQQWQYCFVPQS